MDDPTHLLTLLLVANFTAAPPLGVVLLTVAFKSTADAVVVIGFVCVNVLSFATAANCI